MDEHDKNIDPDILKGRQDILRARQAANKDRQPSDEAEKLPDKPQPRQAEPKKNIPAEPSPMMRAVIEANKRRREQKSSDVPSFDVGRSILPAQRSESAARRTAPGKPQPIENQPTQQPARQPSAAIETIEQSNIPYSNLIADIVARDIETFCRQCA